MDSKNGTTYPQNYDVIIKWLAETLKGETLEVLGVKSGRIEEVFGFDAVDIPVSIERVDVMLRDDRNAYYHIEEQRNLRKVDLYRFASYHFRGAKKWPELTDIILASGEVYAGDKVIETNSGRYAPIVIDFTERDGWKRLEEIRAEIGAGTFDQWLELVFLPLYGKDTGTKRSELVEEMLHFEHELYQAEKIPVRLLIATLIMSNKLIDKEKLRAIWEEIKMLDIFEIAKEEGFEKGWKEGKDAGWKEAKNLVALEATREMVMDALIERFKIVSSSLAERIRSLQNPDVLKGLHRQAVTCQSLQEFEALLQQVS